MAEKIKFVPENETEAVEFYVVEQTTIAGVNYILVTEAEDGDADAYILKDMSENGVEEAVYDSLVFTNLTSMTGDLDNTSQNLFLYYNADEIRKEIEENKKR